MGHELWVIFNWPNGIVVGNLLAALLQGFIVLTIVFVFRNAIGPHLVAYLHRHHVAHIEKLERMVAPDGVSRRQDKP